MGGALQSVFTSSTGLPHLYRCRHCGFMCQIPLQIYSKMNLPKPGPQVVKGKGKLKCTVLRDTFQLQKLPGKCSALELTAVTPA